MSSLTRIMELIPRVKDTFSLFKFNKGGDAVVETKVVPRRIIHSEEFFTQLGYLVELWKFIGVNGVEVIVHSRDAKVVPELIKRGYNFYKVVERKLVLNRWIAEGPSQFPLHETIVMAVEALVVDDSGRILMIRDKQCVFSSS
ncbi:unnamed protein product [Heligmosomoides polygyrus]|uniref:Nudix_hydro domain-containing protein n=1 Tax=Heligmosomoides polygyrus TaxID=6339 RepID=A0A183F7Z2_HELPZ|nr:unnamed protein product [Heligmosomoides polygyrus]